MLIFIVYVSLNFTVKVESLYNGKSLESIKSVGESEAGYIEKEQWYTITIQVLIPFLIGGIGTIGAGIVLGTVEVISYY